MSGENEWELLLAKAWDDIAVMQSLLNAPVSDAAFGFHAQQAVEKACKAWLNAFTGEHPKIHDLRRLFELIERQSKLDVSGDFALVDLNDFAVGARYELWEFEEGMDRGELLNAVQAFVGKIKSSLLVR
jgi:HEPN domain-containing protein